MAQDFFYPPGSSNSIVVPPGLATAANQVLEIADLDSINSKTPALGQAAMVASSPVVIASNQTAVPVSAAALPLPAGASTSANQATEIASLASIDSKLGSALPLPTGAATSALQTALNNKTASAFINSPFDEAVITYVGATTNIATVTYKLASVTVNTLTMSYDGSNRLIDVIKT